MANKAELIAEQLASGINNSKIWSGVVVNVRESAYGAKGNGTTDDAAAIRKAITAAVDGGNVIFPPGTYRIASEITVPANVTLWFTNGAKLSIDSGVTVTITGPIMAEASQIFSGTVTLGERVLNILPQWFGAKGDGVTNDSSGITSFETAVQGRLVDLGGKTFVVSTIPNKNAYYNGTFKLSGSTRPAALFDTFAAASPKCHAFGGQLAKLKESLANPLEQITNIVFIGDSITWGTGLDSENAVSTPRDGTLSDPRDNFASPSFVNTFKRYIGAAYAANAVPVLSNWAASPSGQSTAEYTVQHVLYPRYGDFSLTVVGATVTATDVQNASSLTGYQLQLTDGNVAGTSSQSIKFSFTGDTLTLSFGCLQSDATYYDLYVNAVKQGTYSTHAGVDGFVDGASNNQRVHTFPYVRNKEIEIRTNRNGETTGNRRLRLEAIVVNKKIRITNQGINGSDANRYKVYNLSGDFGDGIAVGSQDNYVFCQLGTNDRIIQANMPKGSNKFKDNLQALLNVITPLANVILMCANPATEDAAVYSFTMQGVRDVIYRTAKNGNLDMIDNYAIFGGVDMSVLTADGVHPNNLGMQLIARNIIDSLESA